MFTRIASIAAAGLIAFGALASVPATAQADSFYFGIGGGGAGYEFRVGDRGRHWDRPGRPGMRGCTAGQAVRKAERMGIRRAQVRGETRRAIHVSGRDRGRLVTVAFGKAPNCPIIR